MLSQPEAVARHVSGASPRDKQRPEDDLTDETRDMVRWEQKHTFSERVEVECTWMHPPSPVWSAREMCKDHVAAVQQSFRTTGKVNPNIIAVVTNDDLYNEWNKSRVIRSQKEQTAWIKDNCTHPSTGVILEVVSGDHSRQALNNLHKARPNDDIWCYVKVKVLLCPFNSETIRRLRILGVRENLAAAVQLKHTYKDMLYDGHRLVTEWRNHNGGMTMGNAVKLGLKRQIMFAWNLKSGVPPGPEGWRVLGPDQGPV